MLRIVADDKIPFLRGLAEQLGEITYLPGAKICRADAMKADALIVRTRTLCNSALLAGTPVRFIATATIGYDHLDTSYLQSKEIGWCNAPGCNATSVAQYIEASLVLLYEAGKLPKTIPGSEDFTSTAKRLTLAIIGVGHVGTAVARVARRLGFRLLLCDPPRAARGEVDESGEAFSSLEKVADEADIITFHTPLSYRGAYATYHLADAAFFKKLREGVVLINAARGEVVDTQALIEAIDSRQVSAAVIDTWENEPAIAKALLQRAFLATPHIAGYSADGKARGTQMALNAVARHFGVSQRFEVLPPVLPQHFSYYPDAPDHLAARYPILRLYDPRRDMKALQENPALFEQLRGNYPLRREKF